MGEILKGPASISEIEENKYEKKTKKNSPK